MLNSLGKTSTILVSYSEILLKSSTVRRNLEKVLLNHVKNKLKMSGLSFGETTKQGGRIFVEGVKAEDACKALTKIFGVDFTAPAFKTSANIEDVVSLALNVASNVLSFNEKFAVKARRVGVNHYTSKDVEKLVGAEILEKLGREKNVKVDLKKPDKTFFIEVRGGFSYIYWKIYKGYGGLPVGTQGKLVAFLGKDPNHALAMWLMMKRGVLPIPVYLKTNEENLCKEIPFINVLREFIPYKNFRVYIAPFNIVRKVIPENLSLELKTILQQILVVRFMCKLARVKNSLGIVTGFNLQNNPIQTLKFLTILENFSDLPLFHPTIGLTREELDKLIKELGFEREVKKEFFEFTLPGNIEKLDVKILEKIVGENYMEEAIDNLVKNVKSCNV
ncbi:MAG: THUMP domain-containing protein [Candidatus Bathyarchaeota archaeon]|nr:THUMP domain-containing protein [Candidatus Bathyarchaeota archaeon]